MKQEEVGGLLGKLLRLIADLFHKLQHGIIYVLEMDSPKKQNPPEAKDYSGEANKDSKNLAGSCCHNGLVPPMVTYPFGKM